MLTFEDSTKGWLLGGSITLLLLSAFVAVVVRTWRKVRARRATAEWFAMWADAGTTLTDMATADRTYRNLPRADLMPQCDGCEACHTACMTGGC